jgi:P-type Mg2+ transporter
MPPDTSLSVEQAVDVAREAADFVLLERGLAVIRRGIEEGRKTFANTLKYVLITTSANLGNMVGMAAASLFLPFLPLTAGQILLNNFLSDVPAVGIADDAVDPELVERPRRWDMRFIGRYMVEFGALSSLFDVLTFGALLRIFHATPDVFSHELVRRVAPHRTGRRAGDAHQAPVLPEPAGETAADHDDAAHSDRICDPLR